uniref:Uncharacterized protein n=1 Tax=Sphaerodactylus townsendi TaxID=933632 RepID=A0ACB8G601_9SAUR
MYEAYTKVDDLPNPTGHEDRLECGVGLILSTEKALISWQPINNWIITARFAHGHAKATVVQVYAPTDSADDEVKNEFGSKTSLLTFQIMT